MENNSGAKVGVSVGVTVGVHYMQDGPCCQIPASYTRHCAQFCKNLTMLSQRTLNIGIYLQVFRSIRHSALKNLFICPTKPSIA